MIFYKQPHTFSSVLNDKVSSTILYQTVYTFTWRWMDVRKSLALLFVDCFVKLEKIDFIIAKQLFDAAAAVAAK